MGDISGNSHFLICPTDIKMVRRQTRRLTRRQTRRVAKVMAPAPAPIAKLSKPVARAVKAIVHRGAERKYVSERPLPVASGGLFPNDSLFNCVTNSSVVEMFPCVPRTIQAGAGTTSSSQRIGQKVKAARMYSDFYIALNPASTLSKDIIVKLWILTSKEFKNYDSIASMTAPINWLNDGQGGSTVSLGNLYDLTFPVENETWTQLKTYTFRLAKSSGLTQNNAAYTADSVPVGKFIRYYHKGGPQQLCFDSQLSAQYPTNYAPVWCVSYAYADGSTPQVTNKDIWVMNQNHLEFYDA